jgi:VCBS repeat-containing protein
VAQNFLTGYDIFTGNTTCAAGVICAGGETTLFFDSTFNGNLRAGHQFRIERVRGPFQFVDPLNTNNQVDVVVVTADHEGKFTTVIRVANGIPAQVAILKITDLETGAYVFRTFTIATATGTLTAIPSTITLTGSNDQTCGAGSVDVLVFDGQAPYRMLCPDPRVQVANEVSDSQPGRFTVNVGGASAGNCLTGVLCVITDSNNRRVTVTVNTVVGPAPTPPPPLDVAPSSVDLTCGASASVTVVGGTGLYSANSTHPRVVATVAGNTVTITRLTGDTAATPPPPHATTGTVTITDGSSIASVDLTTVPIFCPP